MATHGGIEEALPDTLGYDEDCNGDIVQGPLAFPACCSARRSVDPSERLLNRRRGFPNDVIATSPRDAHRWCSMLKSISNGARRFYRSSLCSGTKDRRKFHGVVDEHAVRRDAKTISSSPTSLKAHARLSRTIDGEETRSHRIPRLRSEYLRSTAKAVLPVSCQ